MRIALQMDAFDKIRWSTDSSIFLAREAQSRGAEIMVYQPSCLQWTMEGVYARGRKVVFLEEDPFVQAQPDAIYALEDFDVLLIRQDPPFDMAYVTSTYLLERLSGSVRVINNPVSVRNHPEKLFMTAFPDLMPSTLITADIQALEAFHQKTGAIVIKPLYAHGGYGVTLFRENDPNMSVMAHVLLEHTGAPVVAQAFIPEVTEGDRRLFFVHGTWIGGFKRIPPSGTIRSNTLVGGRIESVAFSDHEKAIAQRLEPYFKEHGLHLVGLDMIGPYVTEVNITSPTGFVGFKALSGIDAAKLFWDGIGYSSRRMII